MTVQRIDIIGSGVAGLSVATLFAEQGCQVTLHTASDAVDESSCSWWAGGMLAPWCELESTEPLVAELGLESTEFWRQYTNEVVSQGSLVLASQRDQTDLIQFGSKTQCFESVSAEQISELEPDLKGRFEKGLYFSDECHLDPRAAMAALYEQLRASDLVTINASNKLDEAALADSSAVDWRIDCRGLSARDHLPDLRGVRGEMLLLECADVSLSRPVRLLHPRYPLYIVPRENQVFMIGATMLESDHRGPVTARSIMELLSAAYALHPAFAEATVLELGADARPAFADNLPKLRRRGNTIYINGLYRHGFLCGPAMAQRAVSLALKNEIDDRVTDENND